MALAGLKEFKFSKYQGLNDTNEASNIGDFEASTVNNWLIRIPGQLKRRMGATVVGNDVANTRILGLSHYVTGSTKVQIRARATLIEILTAGSWVTHSGAGASGMTTDLDMNFTPANGFLYGFNGTDDVRKINESTVTSVAAIPKGTFAVWFRNYLFVGGVAAYPNRIYFSNLGDPETFSVNDYIDVEPGDGDVLTGALSPQSDKIIFAKKYSIHYLTGAGTNTFAVYPITRDFGFATQRAMVVVGNDVLGLTTDARIMSVFRNQYGLMSGKDLSSDFLKGTMEGLNTAQLEESCAFYFDNFVGFAVPTGSGLIADKVLLYDLVPEIPENRSRWTTITGWTPAVFDVYSPSDIPVLYWGEAGANSLVYQWSGNTDNGTAITATWIGPDMELDGFGHPKRFTQIKAFAQSLGDFDVNYYASIDNNLYTLLGPLNLTSSTTLWGTGVWGTFVWGTSSQVEDRYHFSNNGGKVYGKKAQIKITYAESSAEAYVNSFSLYYTLRRWR